MAEKSKASVGTKTVQKWKSDELGTVRTVLVNDEPWFVASDVAKILGIGGANDMTKHLDDDEVGSTTISRSTSGGNPNVGIISESGLYHAIFHSRKAAAKKFRRWVTSEVLPAIRKTGNFSASPVVNIRDMAVSLQRLTERVSALEQIAVRQEIRVSSRERIRQLVKEFAAENGCSEGEVWSELYRDYSKAVGIPVVKCAKAMGVSTIGFIEAIGRMENFRDFAERIFWFVG